MLQILLVSTLSGLATTVGGLVVIVFGRLKEKSLSFLLGFAGGVMLAISNFDLIPSAVRYGNFLLTVIGFSAGVVLMFLLDTLLPHLHLGKEEGQEKGFLKMGYFIAIGIALHNIPEGMGMSVPLRMARVGILRILLVTTLAGIFTPLGTLIGFALYSISKDFVSISLALAAGAMIYIVSDELIPESHKHHSHFANLGIVLGFMVVLLQDYL